MKKLFITAVIVITGYVLWRLKNVDKSKWGRTYSEDKREGDCNKCTGIIDLVTGIADFCVDCLEDLGITIPKDKTVTNSCPDCEREVDEEATKCKDCEGI